MHPPEEQAGSLHPEDAGLVCRATDGGGFCQLAESHTFTSLPGPVARHPGVFGPLAPQWGDAARLPASQHLHNELGTAPLQEGLGWGEPSVLGM